MFSGGFLKEYLEGENERLELRGSLEMMYLAWQVATGGTGAGAGAGTNSGSTSAEAKVQKKRRQLYEATYKDLNKIWASDQSHSQKLLSEGRRLKEELPQPEEN